MGALRLRLVSCMVLLVWGKVEIVFLENIQTPILEEIRNSEGVRGSKSKEIPVGWGFEDLNSVPDGRYNDRFSATLVGHSGAFVGHAAFFLPCFGSRTTFLFWIKVVSKDTSLNDRWGLQFFCDMLATIAHYQSPQITTNRRGYLRSSLIFSCTVGQRNQNPLKKQRNLDRNKEVVKKNR